MKSAYNERFYFNDPLSTWSACRSTRSRIKKLKASATAVTETFSGTYGDSDDQCDFESTYTEDGPAGKQNELVSFDSVTRYGSERFTSVREVSQNASQPKLNEGVAVLVDGSLNDCDTLNHYLNFVDNPQSLEYSDFVTTESYSMLTHEMLWKESEENVEVSEIDVDKADIHDSNSSSQHKNELYKDAPITTASSSVLLMKFTMKHGITQEALADLLKVLQLHFPSPNNLPSTLYHFKKQFRSLQYPVTHHHFCSKCLAEVSKESEFCNSSYCCSDLTKPHSKSSFIEVPVDLQLKCILERDGIYKSIYERLNLRRLNKDRMYTDVYSGSVYQHLVSTKFLDDYRNISLTLNTDGIPVFRSSNFSFWPLYLIINELPFHLRIAKENRILAGLWYGLTKPDMSLFLKPLAGSLKQLYDEGINITCTMQMQPTLIVCHAVLLCTTCDLPAKALVMNMVQFNGFYGCSHCLQPGETHHIKERSYTHIYKYIEENPVEPRRTKKETMDHMKAASSSNSTVFGIKGPSWLCSIPGFDVIEGMSVDYMHCVLLGVTRLTLRLWFQSQYHHEMWYIGKHVNTIDGRLCNIKPPNEMQRTPRSIELTVKFWKAHELRAWLLHYSPAVLYGVLPHDYYQHHLLLVESIYLLLQEQIPDKEIDHAFKLLNHYCFLFAALYGEKHMTINIHSLLHIPDVVKNLGPLWAHSCFPFEAANGELLKLFHGSQSVEKQVITHISEYQKLPSHAQEVLEPGSTAETLFTNMSYSERRGRMNCLKNSVTGKPYSTKLSDNEIMLLKDYITDHNTIVFYPHLCLYNNSTISALSKSKSTKRNNSCIKYRDSTGSFHRGLCDRIFEFNLQHFCIIMRLIPISTQICQDSVTHAKLENHLVACNPPSALETEIITTDDIIEKCIFMDMISELGIVFVSEFPNTIEVE